MTLGVFVLLAVFQRGPLAKPFLSPQVFAGSVITLSNLGSLIGAIITVLGIAGRYVLSGVSRAWLRRRAEKSQGITIKQWRSLSGITLHELHRTPFLAGGMFVAFAVLVGSNSVMLPGTLIPTSQIRYMSLWTMKTAPYLNTGGQGSHISCVNISDPTFCAAVYGVPSISIGFNDGFNRTSSYYPDLTSGINFANVGFLAGVPAGSNFFAGRLGDATFETLTIDTPITAFETTCYLQGGASISQDQYYVPSACQGENVYYGNSTLAATYIWGDTCLHDGSTIVEIALGGNEIPDHEGTINYAIQCQVSAREGQGWSTYFYGIGNQFYVTNPSEQTLDLSGFQSLSYYDMLSITTGLLSAMNAEIGLDGKPGLIAIGMSKAVNQAGQVDLEALAGAVSNALAVSATSGYLYETKDLTESQGDGNPTVLVGQNSDNVAIRGYGWTKSWKLLAYSCLEILSGLIWLTAGIYMVKGGTRYDPTDWFHTLNTSAGSNIQQINGTCTGADLQPRKVNKNVLWYGEIASGHVGFSQYQTAPISPKKKYGDQSAAVENLEEKEQSEASETV
ncbi:hypothetical protein BD324DRAFT_650375 [Kockovaella imperatae]|uniref:Uncharacterized protein n=1 Tax=Kockovaella imperatae TaxID=4999 RepID=A0A1Y1UIF5_9TREE|nr:hypothetical protein BD324DRAFT_650375 [Kockovaella imperatae]ORX37830.1 hypothetical protein BD324DRAFT_650375 [Kockovaella imperatae]